MAVDGDPQTAWLVNGNVVGQHLVIHADHLQTVDHVTLDQKPVGPADQSISEVQLTFDGGDPITVALDPSSTSPIGQTVTFPERTASNLTVAITGVNQPTGNRNGVGFTEVGFGDTRVSETVRLPVDLTRQLGSAANGHRLDVVMTRLRNQPATRLDEETTLDRRFVLPDDRSFLLSGAARVDPNAPDAVIDAALGTTAPGVLYTASSHLMGSLDSRASRAFDHDLSTMWTPSLDNSVGSWLDVSLPAAQTVDHLQLSFVDDAKHFIPAQVTVLADGQPARTLTIPTVPVGKRDGTLRTVDLHFDPVTAKDLRVQFDSSGPIDTTTPPPVALPIAIAEADLDGVPAPASPATVDSGCRSDLVTVDGQPVPIEIHGATRDARRGLAVTACTPALPLTAGSHRLDTPRTTTGFTVDRVVLSSDRAGQPTPPTPAGAPISTSGARVRVTGSSPDSYDLQVHTDGTPFWLVLGQSHNDGWEATVDGKSLGAPTTVNGFANGWVVPAAKAGTLDIHLRWTPQRAVWFGLAVSAVAVLVCLGLVLVRRRRRGAPVRDDELVDTPQFASPASFAGAAPNAVAILGAALTAAVVTAFVSRWWIGLIVGVATALSPVIARGRLVLAAGAPVALALGALLDRPQLSWVALGLLIGDLVAGWWWQRKPALERRAHVD
jgi:hypothetical protein